MLGVTATVSGASFRPMLKGLEGRLLLSDHYSVALTGDNKLRMRIRIRMAMVDQGVGWS